MITDLKAYMKEKNAARRAAAKVLGICSSCNDEKVEEGFTKCPTCRKTHNHARNTTYRVKTHRPRLPGRIPREQPATQ